MPLDPIDRILWTVIAIVAAALAALTLTG